MAKLDAHKEEIGKLLAEGFSQAQIIRQFKDRGMTIARSSLSDFVRQYQDSLTAVAVQDDEAVGERFEASLLLQRATADSQIDWMVQVVEGLQQLKVEGDERHTAMMDMLSTLRDRPAPERDLAGAITRLDALAARTAGAGLRWVWCKAFLWATGFWAVVSAIAVGIFIRSGYVW